MPVATIERRAAATAAQMIERLNMSTHQIANMDVIADTCAIWRRVVGSKDLHAVAKAEGGLNRDLYQVRRLTSRLPSAELGVGAGDIEIAQAVVFQIPCPGHIPPHRFLLPICRPV